MKKIFFILLILITVCTSCSNNNESLNTDASIVGTWNMTSLIASGTGTTTIQTVPVSFNVQADSFNADYNITFTENPNNLVSQGSFGLNIQVTSFGQTMTETIDDAVSFLPISDNLTNTWSLSGNQLTIMSNGETFNLTVSQLTETNLTLLIDINEPIEANGSTVDVQLNGEVTFTR